MARALSMALELHRGQTRKGTNIPYIAHLISVSAIILENGGSENQAIAGLLHDGPEDCGGQPVLDRIREEFGPEVAGMVLDCTDTLETPKPPWRQRKEAYIAALGEGSPAGGLVSLADKVHNITSILGDYRHLGEELWQRFRGGREGTLWYYRALAVEYSKLDRQPLADEFQRLVSELEGLIGGDREN